ncbi:MAG: hypothetical protein ABIR23_08040 [Novosphingobium sp.]
MGIPGERGFIGLGMVFVLAAKVVRYNVKRLGQMAGPNGWGGTIARLSRLAPCSFNRTRTKDMADVYRNDDGLRTEDGYVVNDGRRPVVVERKSSSALWLILLAIVAIIAILFATGFWKADVNGGSMPDVKVSAKGGSLPSVDMQSKEVVVGSKDATIDVPKVTTEKTTVQVPVLGVKDNDK